MVRPHTRHGKQLSKADPVPLFIFQPYPGRKNGGNIMFNKSEKSRPEANEPNMANVEDGNSIPADEQSAEGRTFSQDEVNHIVTERLQREKQKYDNALADREAELQRREMVMTAREKLIGRGFAPELADALNISSDEAFEKSLSLIEEHIKHAPVKISGATPASPDKGQFPSIGRSIRDSMGLR